MDIVITGLICFVAGTAIGAGLLFWLLPARRQASQVMRDRDQARSALHQYREQVDEHFLRTAELVNDMTHAYRAVHEQLSVGANTLCSEAVSKRAAEKSLDAVPESQQDNPAQPLDYAPSAQGTLSEHFGLKDKEKAQQQDAPTPDQIVAPPRDYAEGCEETDLSTKK